MPRFKSREEYEAWKARQGPGSEGAVGSGPATAEEEGFSVAKVPPRLKLLLPAAVLLGGCSIYLFSTGDLFSGFFVLALCAGIAALYLRFRLNPHLEDRELLKASLRAVAMTAASGGRVPAGELEKVRRAKEAAKAQAQKKARDG